MLSEHTSFPLVIEFFTIKQTRIAVSNLTWKKLYSRLELDFSKKRLAFNKEPKVSSLSAKRQNTLEGKKEEGKRTIKHGQKKASCTWRQNLLHHGRECCCNSCK